MKEPKKRIEPATKIFVGKNEYEYDYTAILYSHAFRRLRHKTQVFFFSQNDHVSTRLDHSLYVSAISEIICRNLLIKGIDCDPMLARAIGIGHDLGHAPFGHAGEEYLNQLASNIGGFKHERHGLRIVDKIENPLKSGQIVGLNLTVAVRDGIVNHCGEDTSTEIRPREESSLEGNCMPATIEGCIVRLVDKIAYLGRDLEDAIIAQFINEGEVPGEISAKIGTKNGEIVDYFTNDMITESSAEKVALSEKASTLMNRLMKFNYDNVYKHARLDSYKERVQDVMKTLFDRFLNTLNKYDDETKKYMSAGLKTIRVLGKFIDDRNRLYFYNGDAETYKSKEERNIRIVVDFMSTLTDNFVFQACNEYFLPKPII